MKKWLVILLLFAMVVSASQSFADISLPEVRKSGGTPIFEALDQRASGIGGSFPSRKLELSDLSQLLWAATGLNRGGKGWTVPMTRGKPPYCRIYAMTEDGTFLYDWEDHKLIEINKKDIRADVVLQDFAKVAPCIFVFVMTPEILKGVDADVKFDAAVATGSMSQNMYLASESLNVAVRYLTSINPENITKNLNLPKDDLPLCAVIAGKNAL